MPLPHSAHLEQLIVRAGTAGSAVRQEFRKCRDELEELLEAAYDPGEKIWTLEQNLTDYERQHRRPFPNPDMDAAFGRQTKPNNRED